MADVRTEHPQYKAMIAKWRRCRDAASGQDAVHDAGELYLPKLHKQPDRAYKSYVTAATFFNATWRTIAGLRGMIFRKDYTLNASEQLVSLATSVTPDGGSLEELALEVVTEVLTLGRIGLLVEYPEVKQETLTQADVLTLGLRPFISSYHAESVINWSTKLIDGKRMLTSARLYEQVAEAGAEEFEEVMIEQWRVLDLEPTSGNYRQRIYRLPPGKASKNTVPVQIGGDIFPKMNNAPMKMIPFYIIGVDTTSATVDDPPLIDLVDVNMAHYRVTADYEHGCHFAALPTPWIAGYQVSAANASAKEEFHIGSSVAWVFPSPETNVGYLEFTGAGLEALERNLTKKETQMAVLGARMLEQQKRGIEAADTAAIHRAGESSILASIAASISTSFTEVLQTLSDWLGATSVVEFDLNKDFFPVTMSPQDLVAITSSWLKGAYSFESMFYKLKQGEMYPPGTTLEDERTRLASEPPKPLLANPVGAPAPIPPGAQGGTP